MKLSSVEKQGTKVAKVNIPNPTKDSSFDVEQEIKEIKALLVEILQNINKKS
jgi:hypothetical protein|tara:strand:- start:273 stop:428 length:156 start_codon:yes stop_codon:yes gene_type:complete